MIYINATKLQFIINYADRVYIWIYNQNLFMYHQILDDISSLIFSMKKKYL